MRADGNYDNFEMESMHIEDMGLTYNKDDWAPAYANATLQLMNNIVKTEKRLYERMRKRCGKTGELDVG